MQDESLATLREQLTGSRTAIQELKDKEAVCSHQMHASGYFPLRSIIPSSLIFAMIQAQQQKLETLESKSRREAASVAVMKTKVIVPFQ